MVSSLTIILKDILRNSIAFVDLSSIYYYILPEFFLANGIIVLLGYGIFVFKPNLVSVRRLINYVIGFIAGLLIFMLILLTKFSSYILPYRHVNNLLYFWGQFTVDYIALTFKILLLLVFICLIVILRVYLDQQKMHIFEYVFLMLTSLFGSFVILSANDFLLLYLAIELQALSFYVLAAFNTKSKFSAEGAIKYFIIGSMASAFYLFGVMLLYGVTGTTNFYDLHLCALHLINSKVLATSFIFLLVSLFIKVGAAPFHMWVPDVYQGSPLPVTAFFATVPKIVLLTVFFRLVYYVSAPKLYVDLSYEMNTGFSNDLVFFSGMSMFFDGFYSILASDLFWVVGIVSIFVSVFGGLGQTQLKRLFAYSSIGNIGFIFLALSTNNIESIHAAFVYLIIYILLSLNFFLILIAIRYETRVPIVYISDLNKLKPSFLHILLALNIFSLAGIPPLAGFYNKFYVYYILIANSNYVTTFIVILLTIGSTFYYIRLVTALFFGSLSFTKLLNSRNNIKNYFVSTVKIRLQRDLVFLIGFTSYLNLFAIFHFSTLFNLLDRLVLSFF